MMDIIQNPNPLNEKYTEKHHIIPRFIYRDKNIDIDNSDDNIINLSIKNHILIHYYAAKCCKSEYKWKFVNSILRTLGNIKLSEFENKIDEISNELADTKKLLRETLDQKKLEKNVNIIIQVYQKKLEKKNLVKNILEINIEKAKLIRKKLVIKFQKIEKVN